MRLPVLVLVMATLCLAAGCGESDDESIELPTAAQETGSAEGTTDSRSENERRNTVTFKLFTGESVRISLACSVTNRIAAKKKVAVAAARRLPSLKQRFLNRRRDYRVFLRQHPQTELSPSAYERYRALESAYEVALTRYNRQIRVFNRLADRYNAALRGCRA